MGRVPCSALLLVLAVAASCLWGAKQASGDSGKDMLDVSKLERFVDELPDMPRLQGYGVKDDLLLPGNLTVGMYEKFWVSSLALLFSFLPRFVLVVSALSPMDGCDQINVF